MPEYAVLNGILWVLRTGSHWYEMPDCYPPYQTCHRRFQ
ncbi:transposase [Kistimonas scapharcae]